MSDQIPETLDESTLTNALDGYILDIYEDYGFNKDMYSEIRAELVDKFLEVAPQLDRSVGIAYTGYINIRDTTSNIDIRSNVVINSAADDQSIDEAARKYFDEVESLESTLVNTFKLSEVQRATLIIYVIQRYSGVLEEANEVLINAYYALKDSIRGVLDECKNRTVTCMSIRALDLSPDPYITFHLLNSGFIRGLVSLEKDIHDTGKALSKVKGAVPSSYKKAISEAIGDIVNEITLRASRGRALDQNKCFMLFKSNVLRYYNDSIPLTTSMFNTDFFRGHGLLVFSPEIGTRLHVSSPSISVRKRKHIGRSLRRSSPIASGDIFDRKDKYVMNRAMLNLSKTNNPTNVPAVDQQKDRVEEVVEEAVPQLHGTQYTDEQLIILVKRLDARVFERLCHYNVLIKGDYLNKNGTFDGSTIVFLKTMIERRLKEKEYTNIESFSNSQGASDIVAKEFSRFLITSNNNSYHTKTIGNYIPESGIHTYSTHLEQKFIDLYDGIKDFDAVRLAKFDLDAFNKRYLNTNSPSLKNNRYIFYKDAYEYYTRVKVLYNLIVRVFDTIEIYNELTEMLNRILAHLGFSFLLKGSTREEEWDRIIAKNQSNTQKVAVLDNTALQSIVRAIKASGCSLINSDPILMIIIRLRKYIYADVVDGQYYDSDSDILNDANIYSDTLSEDINENISNYIRSFSGIVSDADIGSILITSSNDYEERIKQMTVPAK